MRDDLEPVAALVRRQAGMVARRQLNGFGIDSDRVRNQVRAGRWRVHTPTVLSVTTGTLTFEQRRWLAVLHAGPGSMLGGLSAAAYLGLRRWEREDVTVLVDDQLAFDPLPGVDFFRTRRPLADLRDPRPGLPVCRVEPAVLLFAGYDAPGPRTAYGVLAAAVQQRLTTAERLREWLERMRPLRRAVAFRSALHDIEGGAQSGAEGAVARMCRRFGLPMPTRQGSRLDRAGRRRWTDCEWQLPDGVVLVLEVDGAFHAEVESWAEDLRRHRRLTTRRRLLVRCSAFELRHEPASVAADLIALGLPGRVPGTAA